MTTRTDHPRHPPIAVRLYEVRSEQGTTWLWNVGPDDARYCVYSHDLIDGMPSLEDLDAEVVDIERPDFGACVAVADEHVRCLFAPLDLRRRLRAFAARAA